MYLECNNDGKSVFMTMQVEIDTSEGSVTIYFSENLSAQVGPLDNECTIFELLRQLVSMFVHACAD